MDNEWEGGKPTGEQKHENLRIRMKIIDLIDYSFPIIERWSVAHQKMLGNKIADITTEMLMLANELEWSPSKKTPLKKLDMLNKGLQDLVTTAYKIEYLKGVSSKNEWTRRSKEIGEMIGGYNKWVYGDAPTKPAGKIPSSRGGTHGRRSR